MKIMQPIVALRDSHGGTRKHFCTKTVPLNFERHVWNAMWLGTAHAFAIHGILMLLTEVIPWTLIFFGKTH
jgi:hypothetical protein